MGTATASTTRRHLLTRLAPGAVALLLGTLLPACGATDPPQATTLPASPTQRAAATAARATPATARPATQPPANTPTSSPVALRPTSQVATPTLGPPPTPDVIGVDCGAGQSYRPNPQSSDPYLHRVAGEGVASPFTEWVRERAALIVLGTVRERQPARWTTPDGRRPVNPHAQDGLQIISPILVAVEQVPKGAYPLPDIYLAAPGGTIGPDCAEYSGSGPRAQHSLNRRILYLLNPEPDFAALTAVPGDDRYRYYRADYSYTVAPDDTVTIGPERDIMGNTYDNPPRTLPLADVLREIAALLATPARPTPTPTR